MTPGERQKWFGLRDPDTDRTPEVSVVPSPFGEGWHAFPRINRRKRWAMRGVFSRNSTMKSKNWRTYYSYRPQTLAQLGRLTDTDIKLQEKAYLAWLSEARGLSLKDAEKHARSQSPGALLSATIDRDPNARAEDWISSDCYIRTVRCHSANAREHWNPEKQEWDRFGGKYLPKSDAPTTYAVILRGRCINSFLSKSVAREWAKDTLARPAARLAA